jgi:hypothetical protein
MKKTIIILSAVIGLLLIALGGLLFLRGNEDVWTCEKEGWAKHGNPAGPMPTEPCGALPPATSGQTLPVPAENENRELIGGQKDEHGCLIGAGYSWCEGKKKCLRTWEEACPASN